MMEAGHAGKGKVKVLSTTGSDVKQMRGNGRGGETHKNCRDEILPSQ
jgi:hypothetical protein